MQMTSKGVWKLMVPSFPQFVQFIIDSEKKGDLLDEHWVPMYKFCTPCLFNFDVIAKVINILNLFFKLVHHDTCLIHGS